MTHTVLTLRPNEIHNGLVTPICSSGPVLVGHLFHQAPGLPASLPLQRRPLRQPQPNLPSASVRGTTPSPTPIPHPSRIRTLVMPAMHCRKRWASATCSSTSEATTTSKDRPCAPRASVGGGAGRGGLQRGAAGRNEGQWGATCGSTLAQVPVPRGRHTDVAGHCYRNGPKPNSSRLVSQRPTQGRTG